MPTKKSTSIPNSKPRPRKAKKDGLLNISPPDVNPGDEILFTAERLGFFSQPAKVLRDSDTFADYIVKFRTTNNDVQLAIWRWEVQSVTKRVPVHHPHHDQDL